MLQASVACALLGTPLPAVTLRAVGSSCRLMRTAASAHAAPVKPVGPVGRAQRSAGSGVLLRQHQPQHGSVAPLLAVEQQQQQHQLAATLLDVEDGLRDALRREDAVRALALYEQLKELRGGELPPIKLADKLLIRACVWVGVFGGVRQVIGG